MVPLADELFADGELTLSLAGTLDMVDTWPGCTAADLSRRSPKTQQAISQLVARLEKLGYVERRVGSGRGVGLYLTAAGHAAQADGNGAKSGLSCVCASCSATRIMRNSARCWSEPASVSPSSRSALGQSPLAAAVP